MSILTDTDLKTLICSDIEWKDRNKIHIYPFSGDCLTPVGYDLRIGNRYSSAFKRGSFEIKEGDQIAICPGDTTLITTLEKVGMPQNRTISALIVSKVSKVSKGLSHISTSIDPDWDGKLLIVIHNHSRETLNLNFAEPFCTVVFFENKSPSTKDCGKPPERSDILLKEWSDVTQKVQRKEWIKSLVPIGIIVIMGGSGYLVFGNQPGFIAMTAIGVGLSQIASLIIKKY
jgi:deoxycytidine triphosphate deaminase